MELQEYITGQVTNRQLQEQILWNCKAHNQIVFHFPPHFTTGGGSGVQKIPFLFPYLHNKLVDFWSMTLTSQCLSWIFLLRIAKRTIRLSFMPCPLTLLGKEVESKRFLFCSLIFTISWLHTRGHKVHTCLIFGAFITLTLQRFSMEMFTTTSAPN